MNLHGIDLNLLLVFEAVYSDRNLSLAGRRLNLSQPAVSNALKRLRDKLNDPLFVRTTDGMIPTAYSESIAGVVTDSLNNLRDCLSSESIFTDKSTRSFRLMLGDYYGAVILPSLTRLLQEQSPNISLVTTHIDRTDAYEQLRDGRVDLVVSTGLNGAGLYQQELFEDSYVTLAKKNHPQLGDKLTLDTYSEVPHVLFSLEGKGISNVDTALAAYSLKRKIALRIPHMSVIPIVLESTDYLATIPKQLADHFLTRCELKMYNPPVDLRPFTVYQYWHRRQHNDPACAWLRRQIKERLFA